VKTWKLLALSLALAIVIPAAFLLQLWLANR
jgi:hypothetical protein